MKFVSRAFAFIGSKLPKGYPDALRRSASSSWPTSATRPCAESPRESRSVAFANGQAVIDFERATGTFFEASFQAFFIAEQWVIDLANFMYMNSHFMLTTGFLVWLYLFRNDSFYFVRNMFMVAMALALIRYALVPTAPPRMFPEAGFVDTINDFSSVNHDSALVKIFVNPYAAMPSMHIAFALMIAIPACSSPAHCGAGVWGAYPLLVLWVVVVTGNHFWFDAAVGALVAGSPPSSPTACSPARARRRGRGIPRPQRSPSHPAPAGRDVASPESGARVPARRPPATGPSHRQRVPLLRARAADRVAADAERDLDDRARPQPRRRGARHAAAVLPRRRRVHRRLGDGHARRPLLADVGQGDAVRRLPRLDPRPDRGGDRADRRSPGTSPTRATTSRPRCAWWPCWAR